MPGTVWDPLYIKSHLRPTLLWDGYIIPMRELNFKEIICLQSHGPCLSKARARVLAKHNAASFNSTTALESVPRVFTDIMSFQSSWQPVRMVVSSRTDLPKCSATRTQLHVSSSSVALWLRVWCLGKGPMQITLLNEGFEVLSRRVQHWWAMLEGPDHNPCDINDSRDVGVHWGGLDETAVPSLLVRAEAGLAGTWKHPNEGRGRVGQTSKKQRFGVRTTSGCCYLGAMWHWVNNFTFLTSDVTLLIVQSWANLNTTWNASLSKRRLGKPDFLVMGDYPRTSRKYWGHEEPRDSSLICTLKREVRQVAAPLWASVFPSVKQGC